MACRNALKPKCFVPIENQNGNQNGIDNLGLELVSPTGQYFNSSALNVSVLGVLETEVPIDDSKTIPLLRDVFLPSTHVSLDIADMFLLLFHVYSQQIDSYGGQFWPTDPVTDKKLDGKRKLVDSFAIRYIVWALASQ
uniref:Uncharacterized protein n=1 Tax=Salix viminalis TaxID=40686 RepID=A0A6N2K8M3_SALVM